MSERWLPVPDHPGYEVSDLGRLRSAMERGGPRTWRIGSDFKVMNPTLTKAGYRVAYLTSVAGKRKLWQVHQLVLLTFVGPCPEGQEGLHADDDGSNNALSNLRYGTPGDNRADQIRNSGPPLHRAKLTEEDVRAIRADPRGPVAIAQSYGVTYDSIRNIRLGRTWSHLS